MAQRIPTARRAQIKEQRRRAQEVKALGRELKNTFTALRENDSLFQLATDAFYIEQLIYERAALLCHSRTLLRALRVRLADAGDGA